MKVFFIKTINILCIVVAMFAYQSMADKRAVKKAEYESESRQIELDKKKALADSGQKMYNDGEYEGSGQGFGGEIKVKVVIKDDEIISATVVSADYETPEYIEAAKGLLSSVIEFQSSEVDTVSGATLSSNGILEGLNNALSLASAD